MAGLTPGLESSGTCRCNRSRILYISVFKQVTQYISPAHSLLYLTAMFMQECNFKILEGEGGSKSGDITGSAICPALHVLFTQLSVHVS